MFVLPPEDRSLSPITGWTRAHWEAVADGLLAAVEPYRSADRAEVVLPGRESWSHCDGLEGYARTFLLAAFRVAGGGPAESLEPYRIGLEAGPSVWPPITDRSQSMVEAASIALCLWLTRERLWDTLPAATQDAVAGWLSGALDHEPVDNNWWLFPVMVGGFLSAAGRPADPRGLERIEEWYVGEGWYSDGANRSFDHYNGWAMHLYPVLHHLLSGREQGVYGTRLREFLRGYALTFDHGGGMLYHGRSLTYRFGSVSSLFAGALAGATPLRPGQTRGIASSVLRHFLDAGALSPEGLLTLGYHGPHEPSLQPYSGYASPYWASKAFVGLLLPPEHPVWTEAEEHGPTGVIALAAPGMIVHNTGEVARLINHGSQHHPGDPLYDRFAYSTRTGPTAGVADNDFAAGGVSRGKIVPLGAGQEGELAWAGSASEGVTSFSVVRGATEIRVHRVVAGSAVTQTGWAIPGHGQTDGLGVTLRSEGHPRSRLVGLYGYARASVARAPEGTAFGAPAAVPVLDGVAADGWAVSAAILGEHDEPLPAVEAAEHLTLTWPDGVHWTTPA
ncbi:MAG: DUF2264 domain-containing protein [Thermoactinospora sp.]|nr:DUF2264 domain-containing protein [Thermoactinospora sp.]